MIRAIIVDDEPLSLQLMEKKLNNIGSIEVVGMFSNGESVLQDFKNLDFQVVFLDIEMAGLSGLDLAEIIMEWNSQIHIVFVTAYRDYAIQAFELDSLDYLLKPVMKDRLEKTVARLQEKIHREQIKVNNQETSANSLINIICFDEFVVYKGDELIKWKTAKVKELFAFFLMHLNTYVNRDTIIDTLWPDQDYKKAKIQLHTSLSYLRKSLDSMGFKESLKFSNQSYSLAIDEFYCDAFELEQIIDYHSHITSENIAEVEKMVSLYTGEYMEKNEYLWAKPKAQTIKEKLFYMLQKMIEYYIQSKELLKKRQCLQMLLKYNPYSENTLQQLILHDLETGNRIEAIQLYHDFVALLKEDLGIDPEQSTMELYESLQKGLA